MTGALARIEARHLARSPLLWLGVAPAMAIAAVELYMVWPVLAGDDMVAYRESFMLGGGALLAGAWLGLRDRTSGAADLVAATPAAPWRLWWARLVALAVVASWAFAVAFAAVLAVSAARGGRGTPDVRLLVDGALAVVLGGWTGVAVGRFGGSRIVSLLVAPLWVAGGLLLANDTKVQDLSLSVQRLSPLLGWAERSAAFGFLPDALWPHLGYLLGLLVLVGVVLLVVASRGSGQPVALRPALAVALAGLVLVGASGARLLALPDSLLVLGPDRAAWRPVDHGRESADEATLGDPGWSYPDDGRARSCAGDATLSVCVYPAYGQGLARYVQGTVRPVAGLLSGLPAAPTRVRMVPTGGVGGCRGAELQLPESFARGSGPLAGGGERTNRLRYADLYLHCAVGPGGGGDAKDAVKLWALLASGTVTRQQLQQASEPGPTLLLVEVDPAAVAPALAMANLPPDQVRSQLAPSWGRVRAGTLRLSELPGQRR